MYVRIGLQCMPLQCTGNLKVAYLRLHLFLFSWTNISSNCQTIVVMGTELVNSWAACLLLSWPSASSRINWYPAVKLQIQLSISISVVSNFVTLAVWQDLTRWTKTTSWQIILQSRPGHNTLAGLPFTTPFSINGSRESLGSSQYCIDFISSPVPTFPLMAQ